jgi:hypothetical protein
MNGDRIGAEGRVDGEPVVGRAVGARRPRSAERALVLVLGGLVVAGCGGGDDGPTLNRSGAATHAGLVRDLDAACSAENRALAALDPQLRAAAAPSAAGPVFERLAGVYRDHVRAAEAVAVPDADVAGLRMYVGAAEDVADAADRFARKVPTSSGASDDAAAVLRADRVRRDAATRLGARGCAAFR